MGDEIRCWLIGHGGRIFWSCLKLMYYPINREYSIQTVKKKWILKWKPAVITDEVSRKLMQLEDNSVYPNDGQFYTVFNRKPKDEYDHYPLWWTGKYHKKTHAHVAKDLMIPALNRLKKPTVLLFGSRGGQITLPTLWRFNVNIPSVVLNGGCVQVVKNHPNKFQYPSQLKMVLVIFGEDFFRGQRSSQEYKQYHVDNAPAQ